MDLPYKKITVVVVVCLSLMIVWGILSWEKYESDQSSETRGRRSVKISDYCLLYYGGIELTYVRGSPTAFQFDLCSVIFCGRSPAAWRGYDLYLCGYYDFNDMCLRNQDSPSMCPTWGDVAASTDPHWLPSTPRGMDPRWQSKVRLFRNNGGHDKNPVGLTIDQSSTDPFLEGQGQRSVYLVLGVDVSGTDPMGVIKINLEDPPPLDQTHITTPAVPLGNRPPDTGIGVPGTVLALDYSKITTTDVVQLATGYGDKNLWLDWLIGTAKERGMGDCVACSAPRPLLFTEPAPLYPDADQWGFHCMLALTKEASATKCTTLAALFPPILNNTRTPTFTPKAANYTCFVSSQSGTALGHLPVSWCGKNITVTATLLGSWARGDLYWFCGGGRLHVRLPTAWQGTCAMVRLGVPVVLIGHVNNASMFPLGLTQSRLIQRRQRDVLSGGRTPNFDLTQGSPTYIDAIGVPRGVPDEFKLADQVATGFENLPIISALFPVTPNKNVDRINYVHYNLLRLTNITRDAIEGLSEQLGPTSLMTVQNRMALDMLLAEKGGVCSMFGGQCCTFIPNNTAPDGSVAKALARLRALSREMQEHSGINDPLEDWVSRTFGKWKTTVISVLLSLTGMVTALLLCGCCCIPCIKSLCHSLIVTTIEGQQVARQLPLLTPKGEVMELEEEEEVTMAVQ